MTVRDYLKSRLPLLVSNRIKSENWGPAGGAMDRAPDSGAVNPLGSWALPAPEVPPASCSLPFLALICHLHGDGVWALTAPTHSRLRRSKCQEQPSSQFQFYPPSLSSLITPGTAVWSRAGACPTVLPTALAAAPRLPGHAVQETWSPF